MEESGFTLGGHFVEATAMFSDIRGFTTLAESQSPTDTIELLNTYYTLMFEAISGQGGVVNQMVGDGLMAIFGAPLPLPNHSEQAVRAALEMIEMIELFNQDQEAQGKPANVIDKIVESGLKTFYKEVCLLEQAFIHDNAKSVAQAVKEAEGKIGYRWGRDGAGQETEVMDYLLIGDTIPISRFPGEA